MATWLNFVLSLALVGVIASQECRDSGNPSTCRMAIRLGYCDIYYRICKKSCGLCKEGSPPTVPPSKPECGISEVMSSRVIAGTRAKPGAWPWQIMLLNKGRGGCGGSLVTPTWVVTASHCVDTDPRAELYHVVLGANDVSRRESTTQVIKVKRVIMHPRYDREIVANDIALLELERPAKLNAYVRTVCLPRQGEVVPVNKNCYLTGWGKTRHPGSGSPTLQQVVLPVVSQETCSELNTRKVGVPITSAMLCAGYGPDRRESGCHGDSGGPFVCQKSNGAFTLQGAVSWGSHRCDTRDSFTVLARVGHFRDWIDSYIFA